MNTKSNNGIIILSISFLIFSSLAFMLPLNFMVNFAHDDSFFYLKIAQNIVNGSGITFDNINSTNGFHPLYLMIVTAIFYILKILQITSSEYQYVAIFIFHLFVIHLIILLIFRFLKQHLNKKYIYWGIIMFILLGLSFVFIRDYGIESHISCLIISFYLYQKIKKEVTYSSMILNAFIITCLFLSRTDYLLTLIPCIIISDYFSYSGKNRKVSLVINIGFIVLMTISYFSINYIFWGHIQTISGSMINSFPSPVLFSNIKSMFTLNFKFYNQFVKIIIFITVFCFYLFKRNKNIIDLILIGISSGLILNIALHLLFNKQGVREWYITVPSFIAIIMFLILYENKQAKYNYILLVFLLTQSILIFYYTRISSFKWDSAIEYAYNLKSITKNNDIIYQYDMSGIISYFSNRKIIDGDGLVNSFEYKQYLDNKQIQEYLLAKKVDYLSTLNYSNNVFSAGNVYIFRDEESALSNIILENKSLYYKYPFFYEHLTGRKEGYMFLFKLKN